jgi:2'-5' RNA ligase
VLSRMRLFTGLSIPSHIITRISTTIEAFGEVPYVRWSPPQNLHLTTKFIGECPDSRVKEISHALAEMQKPAPFEVNVSKLGFVPDSRHPAIFFAGVQADAGLAELAAQTDSALAAQGIAREERTYTPHVTLARIGRDTEALRSLRERMAALTAAGSAFEFGTFQTADFHLYRSAPGAGGSVYSILASYPLPKAAS